MDLWLILQKLSSGLELNVLMIVWPCQRLFELYFFHFFWHFIDWLKLIEAEFDQLLSNIFTWYFYLQKHFKSIIAPYINIVLNTCIFLNVFIVITPWSCRRTEYVDSGFTVSLLMLLLGNVSAKSKVSHFQRCQVFLCCFSPQPSTHSGYWFSVVNRDNVEWSDEQEAAAKKKVLENSQPLPSEKQGCWVFFFATETCLLSPVLSEN